MKKVVFLFMTQGAAIPGSIERRYPTKACGEKYIHDFAEECYFKMLKELIDNNVISDLKIFFESNVEPGIANWVSGENIYCEVIPEIRFIDEYIDEETIIFARGGFKHWHDWLVKYKNKNWLVLYAANTGREKWKFWDVVLDDLRNDHNIDEFGRYWFPFIKPISSDMFYPEDIPYKYDICIGASHIHDKKGQWRVTEILKICEEKFGRRLKAIMPGSFRKSTRTLRMIEDIESKKVDVYLPGMVSREELRKIYNQSKLYVSPGAHGQNDRSLLEALSCGTSSLCFFEKYHSPLLSNLDSFHTFLYDWEDNEANYIGASSFVLSLIKSKDKFHNCSYNVKRILAKQYQDKININSSKVLSNLFSFMGCHSPFILHKEKFLNSNSSFTLS